MSILITGGSGLIGSYLKPLLPDAVYISSSDYDLTDHRDTIQIFEDHSPSTVIHMAAKVGGIMDNIAHPFEYFEENVLMNTNIVKYSRLFNVEKFVGILSSCCYPDIVETYPMTEAAIHDGMPNINNLGYGYSKRLMGIEIEIARSRGMNYSYIVPSNLYGQYEAGDALSKHFVGALLDKIIESETTDRQSITLFGDGTPIRQFVYAGDVARLLVEIIDKDISVNMNVAGDHSLTIRQLAEQAISISSNNDLKINWDTTKPNGQFRKDIDASLLKKVLPNFKFIPYIDGVQIVYNHLKESYAS